MYTFSVRKRYMGETKLHTHKATTTPNQPTKSDERRESHHCTLRPKQICQTRRTELPTYSDVNLAAKEPLELLAKVLQKGSQSVFD